MYNNQLDYESLNVDQKDYLSHYQGRAVLLNRLLQKRFTKQQTHFIMSVFTTTDERVSFRIPTNSTPLQFSDALKQGVLNIEQALEIDYDSDGHIISLNLDNIKVYQSLTDYLSKTANTDVPDFIKANSRLVNLNLVEYKSIADITGYEPVEMDDGSIIVFHKNHDVVIGKYDYREAFREYMLDDADVLTDDRDIDYFICQFYRLYSFGVVVNRTTQLLHDYYAYARYMLMRERLATDYNESQIDGISEIFGLSVNPNLGDVDLTDLEYLESLTILPKGVTRDGKPTSYVDIENLGEFDDYETYIDYILHYDYGCFSDVDSDYESDYIKGLNEWFGEDFGEINSKNLNTAKAFILQQLKNDDSLHECSDGTVFFVYDNPIEEDAEGYDYRTFFPEFINDAVNVVGENNVDFYLTLYGLKRFNKMTVNDSTDLYL